MRRMAKWEEMGRRGGEGRKGEKRRGVPVAFSEMLIDVVKIVRNEPTLSPLIN